MKRALAAWIALTFTFLGLDAAWLITTSAALYRPVLGPILAPAPRLVPAVMFYLVYLTGVMVFALRPALRSGVLRDAARNGALFGFFAYSTYDLTNQATLAVWSTTITALDLCWGTFATAIAATVGFLVAHAVERTPRPA